MVERGHAHWRRDENGNALELVYADGETCGIHPFMDDFDKDKPCDWCGCRLGRHIRYDYETGKMFHHGCYGQWMVNDFLRET